MKWGKRMNNFHDEVGPFHLLKDDGSLACGASYFTTTGPYPNQDMTGRACCRRCLKIAVKK